MIIVSVTQYILLWQNQDSQYYTILDESRWLRYVANCIAFADDAAQQLANNVTVVLQEGK